MTCKQKLMLDHLDWSLNDFNRAIYAECPNHYGYLPTPLDENGVFLCPDVSCDECWDREIPGTANIDDIRRALNDLL